MSTESDIAGDAVTPGAEEVHEEFGAARSHETAETEDFAGAEFEAVVDADVRAVEREGERVVVVDRGVAAPAPDRR